MSVPTKSVTTEHQVETTITIRVYTYPQGDRWYAASTDLPLMTEADDEAQALARFETQAIAYVRTTLERGWLNPLTWRPPLLRRSEIRLRVWFAKRRGHGTIRRRLVHV